MSKPIAATSKATRSSKVKIDHLDRNMKSYQVQENELSEISTMNWWTTTFTSLGSSAWSMAFGLFLSSSLDKDAPANPEAVFVVQAILGLVGLIFFGLAVRALR